MLVTATPFGESVHLIFLRSLNKLVYAGHLLLQSLL